MADMLDKNEKHLFLEKANNTENSFIANVNILVKKVNELVELNQKLTVEQIAFLSTLAEHDAPTLVADLEKGSANGYRKLDIDLLKNFNAYNHGMTDDQKRELWATTSAQVYYESATVMFKDGTSIFKMFTIAGIETPISNHHKLYEQFNDWPEFKAKYGYTLFNVAPDTALHNHELLRFTDGLGNGSTIDYITLHVASNGQNLNYDAVFQGAKEHDPTYTWVDTTSVLLTICNDLASLLNIASSVNDLRRIHAYLSDLTDVAGNLPILVTDSNSIRNNLDKIQTIFENMSVVTESSKYVTELQNAQNKLEEVSEQITADKELTETFKNRVESLSNEIKNLEATATTLTSDQDATAQYDAVTGVLTIGVPKGPIGLKGNDGQDGKDGRDGVDGRDGLPPDHRWIGTALQFRNPDGTWGNSTELKVDMTPPATKESLGQVQIGNGINVDENGVISAEVSELPNASKTTKGVIKVGTGLQIDANGVLSTKEIDIATTEKAGIVKPDEETMTVDEEGLLKDKKEFGYFESMPEGGLPTEDFKEQAYAFVDDGEEVGTLDRIANEVAKRLSLEPIGKLDWFALDEVPEGWIIADGSDISRVTYSALFRKWGTKYGEGDGSTTFGIPNLIGKYIRGGLINEVGTEIEAGLPNIEGSLNNMWASSTSGSGAFGPLTRGTGNVASTGSGPQWNIAFSASKSNEIYGNSDTVTPESLVLLPCIKAFNVISDADNVSIANLAQELLQFRKFIEERSTIIYPNGGTKDNPANVVNNQRYVLDNPYPGYFVQCEAQVQFNGKWGQTNWFCISDTDSRGTIASHLLPDDKIIVQTGVSHVCGQTTRSANPFGNGSSLMVSAPCRVIVTRLGKIPTE